MDNEIPRKVAEDDSETRMKRLAIGARCVPVHLTPVCLPLSFRSVSPCVSFYCCTSCSWTENITRKSGSVFAVFELGILWVCHVVHTTKVHCGVPKVQIKRSDACTIETGIA